MAAIFISYSHRDAGIAKEIRQWLADQGYEQVFLDVDPETGIPVGEDWEQVLYANVARCHVMIVVLSPNWYASSWCFVELSFAKALGKRLMPIVYRPVTDDAGPPQPPSQEVLSRIQAKILPDFEAAEIRDWHEALGDVAKRLRSITSQLARGFRYDARRPPYPGIHAFEAEDAAIYFGRDQETIVIVERLVGLRRKRDTRLLVIIGASGSGKSSLLKAGVIPQLGRDRRSWIVLPVMRPERAPIEALAKSIAHHLRAPDDWPAWRDKLADPARAVDALDTLIENLRVGDAASATVLLPIDQLEELFKVSPEAERIAFLRLVAGLIDQKANRPIMVVATGRSDVLERLSADVLEPVITARQPDDAADEARDLARIYDTYVLAPMPLARIRDLVEGPAGVAGLNVEPGLAQHISLNVKNLDALPLLALTLSALYRLCKEKNRTSMTSADYDSLGDSQAALDPIENAVKRVVAQAIDALNPAPSESEMAALRDAFMSHLVRLQTESGEPLRQPARRSELPPKSLRLIDALRDASLLTERTADATARGASEAIIEVAHEALFKAWPELNQWLTDDNAFLLDLERIRQAYDTWAKAPDDTDPAAPAAGSWHAQLMDRLRDALGQTSRRGQAAALLHGLLLRRAEAWLHEQPQRFYGLIAIRKFIEDSIAAEQKERVRREQVLRRLLGAATVAAAAFLGFFVLTGWQYKVTRDLGRQTEQLSEATEISQSQFLARNARAAVANGNSVLGLKLARQALPSDIDHPDRPFVPQAEYALEEAFANLREVHTIDSRGGAVWSAAYSADGGRVATAGDEGVKVLDAGTGATLATLPHDAPVSAVAFSPDGTLVATASLDGIGRIWDIAKGATAVSLTGHTGALTSIAFSPDGIWVVTTSTDKTARLWNAADGRPIRTYQGHQGTVWSAAFSTKGDRLVTTSLEETSAKTPRGMVRVWSTANGDAPVLAFEMPAIPSRLGESWALDAQFSPDGTCPLPGDTMGTCIVTAGTDSDARIWDAATGNQIALLTGHRDWVNSAAFSSDGTRVATASLDRTVRIWSAAAAAPIAILTGHDDAVDSATFSPDGTHILSASEDHTARIWSTEAGDVQTVLAPRQKWMLAAGLSRDGNHAVTAENVGSNTADATGPAAPGSGEARFWDLTRPGQSAVIAHFDGLMRFAAISPDGSRIITASARVGDATPTSVLYDAATLKPITSAPLVTGNDAWLVAFSRDSTYAVATYEDHRTGAFVARIWLAAKGNQYLSFGEHERDDTTFVGHSATISGVDVAPDDKHLVTVSWDHTGLIWTFDDPLHPLRLEDQARFTWVTYSPDGTRVAGAADDGLVRIWDAKTGKLLSKFDTQDSLYSVSYSGDGRYLLTASKDRTARLWDAQTYAEIMVLRGHTEDVRFAAFADDGSRRIITASQDGTARVWQLPARCEDLLANPAVAKLPPLTDEEKAQYFQSDAPLVPVPAGAGGKCN